MTSSLKNTVINDTGHLVLPVGPTSQRPADNARTVVSFTSVGNTTWTVPSNVTAIDVLVVAGGGGAPQGGGGASGGGGAG